MRSWLQSTWWTAAGELWSKVTLDAGVGEIRVPIGVGIAGAVALSGETIEIPDAYADRRFHPEIDRRTGFTTRNLLALPLIGRDGHVLGVFQLINKRTGAFEAADVEVLASLAASAAVAVEEARRRRDAALLAGSTPRKTATPTHRPSRHARRRARETPGPVSTD